MSKSGKTKRIIAIAVAAVIVVTGTLGYFFLGRKGAPVVNDMTGTDAAAVAEYKRSNTAKNSVEAVLSSNVYSITGADADKVNSSIKSVSPTNLGLYVTVGEGTELDNIGSGDVFFLDGSESTPLGEPYFGKVSSVSADGKDKQFIFETPMVDEVFDLLDLNMEKTLASDDINVIKTIDGVTVTKVDDLYSHFGNSDTNAGDNSKTETPTPLSGTYTPAPTPMSKESFDVKDGLLLECKFDLFKAFGLKEEDENSKSQKYNTVEDQMITVYKTHTGKCYHESTCVHLKSSKIETTLAEAKREKLRPCKVCNPPVSEASEFEPTLNVTGKVGLENLSLFFDYDWDILSGDGLRELSANVDGTFIFEIGLESNAEFEFSGKDTKLIKADNFLKVTGLKEKLFPIAFIGYNGSLVTNVGGGNQAIRAMTAVPVTVGAVFYIDINGNITVGSSVSFSYTYDFNASYDVVKNGKWVWDQKDSSGESDSSFKLAFEAKGDVDTCLGVSIGLYIFNLNPFEITPVKVGAEAEGSMEMSVTIDKNGISDEVTGNLYARIYAKLIELKVNLKIKAELFSGKLSFGLNLDYSRVLSDVTLAEFGTKNPTRYDKSTMSYSNVTASDNDAFYYKNEEGKLIKEIGGQRFDLYTDEFFIICGIDETYIYLLKTNENGCYDICRVNKSDGNNKTLIENVATSLYFDEDSIYYTTDFTKKILTKYNRMFDKSNDISTFSDEVSLVRPDGEGLYVVTSGDNFLSWFIGSDSAAYYIEKDGSGLVSYGKSFDVSKYHVKNMKNYSYATRYISGGYLRSAAEQVVWLGADSASNVIVEGTSGWNPTEDGIFVTKDNYGSTPSHRIVLYKAADGSTVDVAPVYNTKAFFTLCKGKNGKWYFIDQTDDGLILCTMNEDFSDLTVIQNIDLAGRSVDLDKCGAEISNNQVFFYNMQDNKKTEVLYRYNVAK